MKIYVTGVSGTGKSSIARELNARGVPAIDMDDLCHWQHKPTGERTGWEPGKDDEWYEKHGWICSIESLQEFLTANDNAVALGLSSNQDEYLPFFDKVLILRSKPEVITERINKRTDNDYGKHPAEQGRILNWHKTFEKEMVDKGAIPLDADRELGEVVDEIVAHLGSS